MDDFKNQANVQQQSGDGTFYINNITNNIIMDKKAGKAPQGKEVQKSMDSVTTKP